MQVLHLASASPQGGMSEKIRNFDWHTTALGPLHLWPASLRIAVDMMLGSKIPGCLVWGPQMVTLYNDAFKPILGAKPEALGRGFDDVWSDAWDSIGAMVFRAYAGEAIFFENFPMMTNRNGVMEQTYFTFCYSPVRDESGEVVGFLDTVIETTANVESLQQWRTLANTFEQQVQLRTRDRNRFWQLSADVMLKLQHDLTITAVNPAWSQVLGWKESEVLDTPLINLVHFDDVHAIEDSVRKLDRGVPSESAHSRLRHKDGHYRWFSWSAMPSEEGYTAVGNDITLEREREEALFHAEELLRHSRKMETIGQFSGGVAHDFNNLLTGISGSLELLERRIAQGRLDKLQVYIDAARNAADRAAELTHRLLAFSRRQTLAPKPTDVNELMLAMETLIQQTMGPAVSLQVQIEPAPWLVMIDAHQLENAVLNLCVNARDAMRGAGSLRVSTGNERHVTQLEGKDNLQPGDYVYVKVQDDGHGMSAQVAACAFDPFFTTKPIGQGTGLGLSMVYGFVRQSGGQAWIESTPGAGTQITMLLPRYTGSVSPVQEVGIQDNALVRPQQARILLIDDESTIRMLIKEALQEQGFNVYEATNAESGLALFRAIGPIDLLITDIGLPGAISGRQVASTVRLLNPEQKVLFITGYSQQSIFDQDSLEPGVALLAKPFALDALVHQVYAMLEQEQALPSDQQARSDR